MNKPFFSIIVVSLNAEDTIKDTIESILNQSFSNYEIIVKDGCSKDETIDRIPQIGKIKIVIQPDKGIYEGMNQAIGLCSGNYLCFMNCGDKYNNNNVLQEIFDKAVTLDDYCNVLYSDYKRNKVIFRMPNVLYDFYLYRTPLNHQSMYFGKEIFKRYGYYDTEYKILADYEYTLRTYRKGVKYIYCECVSCDYLGNGISESIEGIRTKNMEYKKIRSQYFSRLQLYKYKAIIFISFKKVRGFVVSDKSPLFLRKTYRNIVNIINQVKFNHK
ncbi:MAG: glycosyltransferase family 2 protein [Clostridiaceae bacterium]